MSKTKIATVEKLAFGGMGIVRDGTKTVFVPFVIPGEKIKFKIIEGTKKPVMGRFIEVLESSDARREPPCGLFTKCGGCQLQHIAYKTQLKLKREIVKETFARIAKLEMEIDRLIAGSPFNYRSRAKFRVRKNRLGFLSRGGKNFVHIKYCHIVRRELNCALKSAEKIIEKHHPTELEFILLRNEVYAVLKGYLSDATYKIAISNSQKIMGNWTQVLDFQPVFQQINAEQNNTLKNLVKKSTQAVKPNLAVELFCGDGNLTDVLIPYCERVLACDVDEHAISIARARFQKKSGKIKFFHRSAEQFLEELLNYEKRADFVLLDPPRKGAKSLVPLIARLQPQYVFYVSCDPPTMARDIALFQQHGYKTERVTPVDMFPQTGHIELTATLIRF